MERTQFHPTGTCTDPIIQEKFPTADVSFRSVAQHILPLGGEEQTNAINLPCSSGLRIGGCGGVLRLFLSESAFMPPPTKRRFVFSTVRVEMPNASAIRGVGHAVPSGPQSQTPGVSPETGAPRFHQRSNRIRNAPRYAVAGLPTGSQAEVGDRGAASAVFESCRRSHFLGHGPVLPDIFRHPVRFLQKMQKRLPFGSLDACGTVAPRVVAVVVSTENGMHTADDVSVSNGTARRSAGAPSPWRRRSSGAACTSSLPASRSWRCQRRTSWPTAPPTRLPTWPHRRA